jgi:hypothetical protein
MNPHDFSIALRIRHPSIAPAEVTRQLGIEPHCAWRAGEPRHVDAGEVGSAVHRETYWVGLLPTGMPGARLAPPLGRPGSLIAEALKRVTAYPQLALYVTLLRMKAAADFWRGFAEQGGTVVCLLQVHNAERFQLDLSPALLLALVELKITLSIDFDGGLRAAA